MPQTAISHPTATTLIEQPHSDGSAVPAVPGTQYSFRRQHEGDSYELPETAKVLRLESDAGLAVQYIGWRSDMAINFKNMRSEDEFEEMCRQLVRAEHPQSVPVEANPGDEGMDSFEGVIDAEIEHVWQFKHFPYGIGKSQQDQIRKSLKDAIREHKPQKWTFITSTDLRPGNHRWVKKQQNDFPEVSIAVVPATEVRQMLIKHQDIRKQYFPLQDEKIDALMRMTACGGESGSLPKAAVLQNIQNDSAILNDDSPYFKYTFSFNESGTRIVVEPRTPEASGKALVRMTLTFPDDAEAKADLKQYMADVDTGRPIVVPGQYVTIHESVFDQFMDEGNRISELHIIPKIPNIQLPTRIHVSHDGDEASVSYVDLRLTRRGKRELEFSNAAQKDTPFKVCMTFKDTQPATFEVLLTSVASMRPSDVIEFERAVAIMGRAGATITLESLKTGAKITSPIEVASEEMSQGRVRLYEDLLLIERELDPELTLPDEITESDYASILGIVRALRVGKATKRGTAKVILVPNDRMQLNEIVESGEPVTWVTRDGIEGFVLFGCLYEFGFETIMTGPVTILEEGLPDGGVQVGMTGEIHITYGNGRCAGITEDLQQI